jgi:hypothetical protein
MKKVFIGGSRRLTRLDAEVNQHIDKFIKQNVSIIIGDANGIDKAVQKYFKSKTYDKIEVFCMQGNCRNNIGGWVLREISGHSNKRDYSYHAIKDQQMAEEATLGFMIWDGKSRGTLANVFRLIQKQKPVDLYNASQKKLLKLKNKKNWDDFISQCSTEVKELVLGFAEPDGRKKSHKQQMSLFPDEKHGLVSTSTEQMDKEVY